MPRVLRQRPDWLKRGTPGHGVFSRPTAKQSASGDASTALVVVDKEGCPSRKVAASSTQLFVAKQNELRWTDLLKLRNDQEQSKAQYDQGVIESTEDEASSPFRVSRSSGPNSRRSSHAQKVLKVPVYDDIQQLALSPNGRYLAIATHHTVFIALVPDAYHLTVPDDAPLKVKTFQVGPTTHIQGRSRVVSLLWHPLGVDGSCLTTVTHDAIVRLWEFEQSNRMSVNSASLAVDLKALANGTSASEDFSPSKFGAMSFTVDFPYMQVASACYGGSGGSDLQRDGGWSTSTLWVAMKDGGIYALCPLLPSKFAAPPKMLDELVASSSLHAQSAEHDEDDEVSNEALRTTCDQLDWLNGIEKHPRGDDFDLNLTVYHRPSRPSPVPMLQGPYNTSPNSNVLYDDITDIFAMPRGNASRSDSEGEFQIVHGDESDDHMPVDALCVATADGRVHICLDMKGTAAKWLPTAHKRRDSWAAEPSPVLLLLESVEVNMSNEPGWPMFTPDVGSSTAFFVTHSQGVTRVDMSEMMQKLAEEMDGSKAGTAFRLKMLMDSPIALEQDVIRFSKPLLESESGAETAGVQQIPSACVFVRDVELGDYIVTETKDEPHAVQLDYSDIEFLDGDELGGDEDMDALSEELEGEARETYEPAPEFFSDSNLPAMMKQFIERNPRRSLRDQMRVSNFDLEMLTAAHPVLAGETQRINDAVSRLFSRTQRLQQELREQLRRAHEMNERIEDIADDAKDEERSDGGQQPLSHDTQQQRMAHAAERQEELEARVEELKAKVARLDKRPLNVKEREWISHVNELDKALGDAEPSQDDPNANANVNGEKDADIDNENTTMLLRVSRVTDWKQQLLEQTSAIEAEHTNGNNTSIDGGGDENAPPSTSSPWSNTPGGGRRRGGGSTTAIREMLERERAMVEATRKKLDELLAVKLAD